MLDRVDEEQAEHLDAKRREALFLLQMLVDCPAQHQPLQRIRVHVADGLTRLEKHGPDWRVATVNEEPWTPPAGG